ncbi:hypothetical protein K469DRAFT_704675 [Zopfia rhizophila CBS 207.26]|uniref:Uncharacterized protein n=1 Tax=Zopfia rhizophila CBS 207.26 TaxID=1314779 RepID=A0A6A6EAC4_9PEZI|nr:hypothetical protein K469DRAFT_704675 [Zopfia rhizophila CBS 207.26]
MDDIVAYFEELVVVDAAAEDGLDRFWETDSASLSPAGRHSPTMLAPPVPSRSSIPALPSRRSPLLSSPRSHTPVREGQRQPSPRTPQRMTLQRLLNPASFIL